MNSTKSILLDQILPKLHKGRMSEWVRLDRRDCEALLLILSQSVDIEPLIRCFHSLIRETLIEFKPDNNDVENDQEVGFPYCKYLFQERRNCHGFVMAMNGSQNECENRSNSGKCHSAAAMTIWREKEDIHG